jgi:ribose transport system substrate-binding protein
MRRLLPGTGIDLVANEGTSYTMEEACKKAQAILQANRDLRFIISNYSGMTQGIVRAVREAGLQKQVKISDFSGSQWALNWDAPRTPYGGARSS